MPSFDIVSKINLHEVINAIDQANREVTTRFDFKGTNAHFEYNNKDKITLIAPAKFQLQQMLVILEGKFTKRQLDLSCLEHGDIQESLHEARQELTLQQGIKQELAKKIVKFIKDMDLKVQTAIQGEQLRVTGKKRDDLQEVIARVRAQKWDLPLQYENFRD